MTTNEEIIEKRLAIKAIMYICPECDARIIFRNNADKHEHKTYRVAEFSEEELKTMLSEAHAAGRAEVQSGKLTEVGQSLYDRRKHIEAHTAKQLDALLDEMETRADFFYKDATDLANKNYERGFFDGIHNARAKIKEALENKAIK